jgi:DNA repair exonuclease SbcCD ATPase subunit
LTTLATRDNEEYLTGLLHTAESSQQESVLALQSTVSRGKQLLNEYVEREKRLLAEKVVNARKLTSQAATFQREKGQFQQSVAQNAKQLVEVHNSERCKAEQNLQQMSRHVSEAEARATEADRVARTCRESETETKAAFQRSTARLEELELKEQEAAQRTKNRETELVRLSEELRSSKESHSEAVHRESEMRAHIKMQEESLANTEESHGAMREGLESLFGDMVSLSQLYEIKEREAASMREGGDAAAQKLQRKLEAEQKRTIALEEKYRQIQCDNDMLSKKYQRAREKLEEERKQSQKDAERRTKRTGPVSYINQLHTSTVDRSRVDTSTVDRSRVDTSTADRSRGGKERSRGGKENDSHSTASSSARRSYR